MRCQYSPDFTKCRKLFKQIITRIFEYRYIEFCAGLQRRTLRAVLHLFHDLVEVSPLLRSYIETGDGGLRYDIYRIAALDDIAVYPHILLPASKA